MCQWWVWDSLSRTDNKRTWSVQKWSWYKNILELLPVRQYNSLKVTLENKGHKKSKIDRLKQGDLGISSSSWDHSYRRASSKCNEYNWKFSKQKSVFFKDPLEKTHPLLISNTMRLDVWNNFRDTLMLYRISETAFQLVVWESSAASYESACRKWFDRCSGKQTDLISVYYKPHSKVFRASVPGRVWIQNHLLI